MCPSAVLEGRRPEASSSQLALAAMFQIPFKSTEKLQAEPLQQWDGISHCCASFGQSA